jgi:hypothetical protein
MALPLVSWGAFLGLTDEVTWGTPVTPSTHWLPIVSDAVEETPTVEAVPYLGFAVQAFHNPRDLNIVARDAGGPIVTVPTYDQKAFAMLLKHCFGAAPSTTGAGPYDHEYVLSAAGTVFATLQKQHGTHASLDRAEIVPGAMVNDWEFSCDARGQARMKVNWIAQKASGMSAISGTPSVAASEEMLGNHFGDLTWNAVTHRLNKFSLKVNRNLKRRPYLGSLYTDQPVPGGQASITLAVELDWVSHALYAAMLAGTAATGSIVLTGTGNNRLTITIDGSMILTKCSKPLESVEGMRLRAEWLIPATSSTAHGVKFVLRNDNSNAIT